jgi:glycosyltransferase involved in cell wall biosynthesis
MTMVPDYASGPTLETGSPPFTKHPAWILHSCDPWIIVSVAGPLLPVVARLACNLIPAPVTILCMLWWSAESHPSSFASQYHELRREIPNLVLYYLCNTITEQETFARCGIPAIHCNHNAFVSEREFEISTAEEKRYDAIYNAALSPYKRHHLCSKIPSLALISYRNGTTQAYVDEISTALGHATWVNRTATDFRWLGGREVCEVLNQSRVGLCLSREEGAMYASVEYLLCGLPVVSTYNLGGRNEFFHEDYVVMVDDCPDDVANAVAKLCATSPDKHAIRSRTIARLEEHRSRFSELVSQLGGLVPDAASATRSQLPFWPHRLIQWVESSEFEEAIESYIG